MHQHGVGLYSGGADRHHQSVLHKHATRGGAPPSYGGAARLMGYSGGAGQIQASEASSEWNMPDSWRHRSWFTMAFIQHRAHMPS
jgi:hypothetical protein